MTDFPQIVVGTYEEFVLGFRPQNGKGAKKNWKLQQTFATHSHQASVRCVAANKRFMASSGADEFINIYDMSAMKVFKVINYHDATVTCLRFTPDSTHLVTANQKGDIAIFRCRDWALVKLWKEAHKNANGVTSISVHPTGSLLITTGADNILRFWNLIKGRQAYATNYSKSLSIGSSLNFGLWSPNGKYYVVCIGKVMEAYKTQNAAIIYKVVMKSKITCVAFSKINLVSIGNEEGVFEIHSLIHKKLFANQQAHGTRLKCMSSFTKETVKNGNSKVENYLVTADSKGIIKLWHLKKKGLNCIVKVLAEVDCDCRITCLTMVPPKIIKKEKQVGADVNASAKEKVGDSLITEAAVVNSVPKKRKRGKRQKVDSVNEKGNGNYQKSAFDNQSSQDSGTLYKKKKKRTLVENGVRKKKKVEV